MNRGDKQTKQKFVTNKAVPITIRGQSEFDPGRTGIRHLELYVNIWLPPAGSPARKALARGGWTVWFEQTRPNDQTGYNGPVPVSVWGERSLKIAHTWTHGVKAGRPVRFWLKVDAFDSKGKPVSVPLEIGTRNVRVD